MGTAWPLGLVCRGDVEPAVQCKKLRASLHAACNGNLDARDRMIEDAMSLSMFPRNNSPTILQYHALKACQEDSPEHAAFLQMKLQVWESVVAEWGRVYRLEELGQDYSSDSDSE